MGGMNERELEATDGPGQGRGYSLPSGSGLRRPAYVPLPPMPEQPRPPRGYGRTVVGIVAVLLAATCFMRVLGSDGGSWWYGFSPVGWPGDGVSPVLMLAVFGLTLAAIVRIVVKDK